MDARIRQVIVAIKREWSDVCAGGEVQVLMCHARDRGCDQRGAGARAGAGGRMKGRWCERRSSGVRCGKAMGRGLVKLKGRQV